MRRQHRPGGSIEIQDRDLDVLRGLFESRVMSEAHIASLYFGGRTEMAKKRLQKLAKAKLVARHADEWVRPKPFVLSHGGLVELRERGILDEYPSLGLPSLSRRSHVSALTIRHELEVMDVKVAICRGAKETGFHVREFTTWPLLNQFPASYRPGMQEMVKPDGFLRVEKLRSDDEVQARTFFIELDRSTEGQTILVKRAISYLDHYHSGRSRDDARRHPFRALYVLKTAERRNNMIELLLRHIPIMRNQIWLTTVDEITKDPFGPIWMTPLDYRKAVAGSDFDSSRRLHQWGYKRRTSRDVFVERQVAKRVLFSTSAQLT